MIRQGDIHGTVERIAQHGVVLAIQDTTELNYTTHKALSGTGYLDSKYAQGLKVHSVLTVSPQGIPFVIAPLPLHHRKIAPGDGFPGVKVLWRGLTRLHDFVQGWQVCQSLNR